MSGASIGPDEGLRIREMHGAGYSAREIAATVGDEFGAVRSPKTVANYITRSGARAADAERRAAIKLRLRALFKSRLSGKEAARVLEREFGHVIEANSVCAAWRAMGLNRGHRPPPAPYRGRLPIPAHAHPLVQRLIRELNQQQTTLSEVAERAGLRRRTVGRWATQCDPQLSNFVAALNVVDLDLAIVARSPE